MKRTKETKRIFTNKELAYIFCTTIEHIKNLIKAEKFSPNDALSIFKYYGRNYAEGRDRIDDFNNLVYRYESHQSSREEKDRIEELYRDWDMEDCIQQGLWNKQ